MSVRDKTHVRRDLWDRAEEDTLTGLFLREMRRRLEQAADDETRAAVELAVRFGLAALEHREEPWHEDQKNDRHLRQAGRGPSWS